jgi:hypothetical protein
MRNWSWAMSQWENSRVALPDPFLAASRNDFYWGRLTEE